VIVKCLEGSCSVFSIAIPLILVVGILEGAKPGSDVDSAKNDLVADDAPGRTTFLAGDESLVEPVLLLGAHQGASYVIVDLVDVVGIVIWEVSDCSILLFFFSSSSLGMMDLLRSVMERS